MDLFDIAAKIRLDTSGYEKSLEGAEKQGSSFSEKLKNGLSAAAKVGAAALGAAATGISTLVGKSIDAYADYEQLVGGVETLFGNSYESVEQWSKATGKTLEKSGYEWEAYQNRQATVLENANQAYKTAGLSANEYMETVTGFAAALNSSLGENAYQSAYYADQAITDMADNANKMGSSIESIKNAYAGFSKQNFTMLDNLKLGYGGTKAEMDRLLRDAEKLAGYKPMSLDANNFADVVDAIHIIQEDLGIAGTTAKEASETISGSVSSMKSSWENLVTGIADENADFEKLVSNFVDSAVTVGDNILPRVEQALNGVGKLIEGIAPVIVQAVPTIVSNVLPSLLESAASLVSSFAGAIIENLPTIANVALDIIMTLVNGINEPGNIENFVNTAFTIIGQLVTAIGDALPTLITAAFSIIAQLATSIGEALPELIPAAVSMVIQIVESLLDNIDLLIDAAIQLIIGLATGLIEAIPILLEKAPEIIAKLVQAIIRNAPKLLQAAATLISTIGQGIVNAWEIVKGWGKDVISKISEGISSLWADVVSWGSDIINNIAEGLTNGISSITDIGKNIISGIWEGISGAAGWLWDKISGWATGLLNGIKGLFGIASPSKVFRDQIGKWLPLGLEEGFEDEMPKVENDLQNSLDEMAGKLNANISYSNGKNISNRMYGYDLQPERPIYLVLDSGELVGKIVQKMDVALGNENTMKLRFGGATV